MLDATLMLAALFVGLWLCSLIFKPCGRVRCGWCKRDMGAAHWLPKGEITHGICKTCYAAFDADIDKPR